ncbi:hypothetical protein [Lederbergia lenta]|uniref:Uncharacterized protein n=1 Tax=Lederbergia lenta TaxID=1467 RepID=A0A2X4WUX4_LEDLE|nr:hypothetical protein [Lederbergia lenta]MEC2326702.1 hypothetical protein [Lederbergia lenta]SQI61470.1 Uncharacterised protein [Lederbergia lenta]
MKKRKKSNNHELFSFHKNIDTFPDDPQNLNDEHPSSFEFDESVNWEDRYKLDKKQMVSKERLLTSDDLDKQNTSAPLIFPTKKIEADQFVQNINYNIEEEQIIEIENPSIPSDDDRDEKELIQIEPSIEEGSQKKERIVSLTNHFSSLLENPSDVHEETSTASAEFGRLNEDNKPKQKEVFSLQGESDTDQNEDYHTTEESSSFQDTDSYFTEESSSFQDESNKVSVVSNETLLEEENAIKQKKTPPLSEESSTDQEGLLPIEYSIRNLDIKKNDSEDKLSLVQFPMIKAPVLLATVDVDIDICEVVDLIEPLANIRNIDWVMHSMESYFPLCSSTGFLKGKLLANIEYSLCQDSINTLHTWKISVPWEKVININWLHPPNYANKSQSEFTFLSHVDQKAHIIRESNEMFAERIESDLRNIHYVWLHDVSQKTEDQKLNILGNALLSIDLLQPQYVDLHSHFFREC